MATKADSNRGIWLATAGLLVLLVVGGYFTWRLYQEQPSNVVAVPRVAATAPDAGSPALDPAEGDALLKAAAGDLSAEATFATWLAVPDLVRRLVAATFQVSRGESPRELLGFMQPQGAFAVEEIEDKTTLAPKPKVKVKLKKGKRLPKYLVRTYMSAASCARYDPVRQVIDSIDTTRLGALYARLAPFADLALRGAAPPGKTVSGVFSAAVDHLTEVPISDVPIELVSMKEGVGYTFKDEKLEALSAAQKHLVRMGPANARMVLKKLQSFRTAAFEHSEPHSR